MGESTHTLRPTTAPPGWGTALENPALSVFQPFLDALPGGRGLLAAVEALVSSGGWSSLQSRARALFVDELGYDARSVRHTERLRGRSAIEDLIQIADYRGLAIAVVRLTRDLSDTRWSNTASHYEPVFRLLPAALLVSWEPGAGVIRLVYRRDEGALRKPRYRCAAGPWYLRDPGEDLLTMTWRVAQLRPVAGDDPHRLEQRIVESLELPVAELSQRWRSRSFTLTDGVPGPLWEDATRALAAGVIGPGWWGLGAVLRQLFPATMVWGEAWLVCRGFEPVGQPEGAERCWRQGESRLQAVRLHFVLRSWDLTRDSEPFTVDAALPVPTAGGEYVLEGDPWCFVPRLGAQQATPEDEEDEEILEDTEDDGDEDETDAAVTQDWRVPLASVRLDSHLAEVLERRLSGVIKRVRHQVRRRTRFGREALSPGLVRAAWLSSTPPGEPFRLLLDRSLRGLLQPVEHHTGARPLVDVEVLSVLSTPPHWACPRLSSGLQPRQWAVHRSARITPAGDLAVPTEVERGLVLQQPDPSVLHPWLDEASTLPRAWFQSESFGEELGPSEGGVAVAIAGRGLPLQARGVVSSELRAAWLHPSLRPEPVRLRWQLDLAGPGGEPEVRVREGQVAAPGATWVARPRRVEIPEPNAPVWVKERLRTARLREISHHLPWDLPVRVLRVGQTPRVVGRHTSGWRLWIEAVPAEPLGGSLLVAGGRPQRVERGWHPEVLPTEDGAPCPLWGVPGEGDRGLWLSGLTGEVVAAAGVEQALFLRDPVPLRRAAGPGVVDRLPRHLGADEPWSLTRLRAVGGSLALGLARAWEAGRSNRHLLERCAGLRPVGKTSPWGGPPTLRQLGNTEKYQTGPAHGARCVCGALQGVHYLGLPCEHCGEAVKMRPVEPPLRWLALSPPVLHPWRKELAAALLGLTPEELELLLGEHGPTPILRACASAWQSPAEHVTRRLALPRSHPRAVTGLARHRLHQVRDHLSQRSVAEAPPSLQLDGVGVPPHELAPTGTGMGLWSLAGGVLVKHLARVQGLVDLARHAARTGVESVEISAAVALQRAVDRVFGKPSSLDPDTLAGLLHATDPWTLSGEEPVALARAPQRGRPAEPTWWRARAARVRLAEGQGLPLVVALAGLPGVEAAARRGLAQQLAALLVDEREDPSGLYALLERAGSFALRLADDPAQAVETVTASLDELGSPELRAGLATLLCGWWFAGGDDRGQAARWLPLDRRAPLGWQRRLPALDHPVWRTWPGMAQVSPGLRFLGLELADTGGVAVASAGDTSPSMAAELEAGQPAPEPPELTRDACDEDRFTAWTSAPRSPASSEDLAFVRRVPKTREASPAWRVPDQPEASEIRPWHGGTQAWLTGRLAPAAEVEPVVTEHAPVVEITPWEGDVSDWLEPAPALPAAVRPEVASPPVVEVLARDGDVAAWVPETAAAPVEERSARREVLSTLAPTASASPQLSLPFAASPVAPLISTTGGSGALTSSEAPAVEPAVPIPPEPEIVPVRGSARGWLENS
ncbi:MAG: hypothetical protein JXX28_05750 [Deltaproteobacteria bacterium]|nr:hypothetical protein [Deltaproteobacteria bacterium]